MLSILSFLGKWPNPSWAPLCNLHTNYTTANASPISLCIDFPIYSFVYLLINFELFWERNLGPHRDWDFHQWTELSRSFFTLFCYLSFRFQRLPFIFVLLYGPLFFNQPYFTWFSWWDHFPLMSDWSISIFYQSVTEFPLGSLWATSSLLFWGNQLCQVYTLYLNIQNLSVSFSKIFLHGIPDFIAIGLRWWLKVTLPTNELTSN